MSTDTKAEPKRPNRISMEGMIWNANQVLSWVLDPKTGGVNPELFGPSLLGIAIINVVEAGFVFSGNVGTGIIIARDGDGSNKWSPPSAIGLTGVGFGIMMGASAKEIVYLIHDPETLKSLGGDIGVKLGTQVESTFLNWGRTADATANLSNKGVGANFAISYSQGLFGGLSVEGGVLNPRTNVNETFYGKKVTPHQILFDHADIKVPEGTLIDQVYRKLNLLCSGTSKYEASEEEHKQAQAAFEKAEQAGATVAKEHAHDIVLAEDEIKKETSS